LEDNCPECSYARGYGGQLSPSEGLWGTAVPQARGYGGQLSPKRGVMGTAVPQARGYGDNCPPSCPPSN